MIDIIVGLIVVAVLVLAVRRLVICRKRGNICSGCSNSSACMGECQHYDKKNKSDN